MTREIVEGRITPGTSSYSEELSDPVYLRTQNIAENHLDLSDAKRLNQTDFDRVKSAILRRGDVVLTIDGALLGIAAVATSDEEHCCISNHIVRILNGDAIQPKFLSCFLNSSLGQQQIQRGITGSAIPGIRTDAIGRIVLPLPPLEMQEKLVSELEIARTSRSEKLTRADGLLNGLDAWLLEQIGYKRSKIIDQSVFAVSLGSIGKRLDAYANKSRFRALFQNLLNMKVEKLSDLSFDIFSGTTPTAGGEAYVDPPNGVAFVRSGEIGKDGLVRPTHEIHIATEIHEKTMKRSQLRDGDILVAIVGATIGAVGVYSSSEPANINQAIAAIRLKDKISPEYLAAYISSSLGQEILDYFKRPVARANINLEEIGQMPIIVVDRSIQDQISDERSRLRKEAENLRAEAETEWQTAKQQFENSLLQGEGDEV